MQCVRNWWRSASAASLCLLFSALGAVPLGAQSNGGGASVSGTVVDQAAKPILGAAVTVKNDTTGATQTSTTDAEGHFSVSGIPSGSYSIDVTSPGFANKSFTGVHLSEGKPQDVPITMTVESLAQSVTVSESISLAASTAPSGNLLDSTSAKTEVSSDFIHNFMSPVADYSEYVNYAPGTFSLNPNGIGLGQGKTFFRGFPDGDYTMTFDGIPFEDTNTPTHHSWANFPSGWTDSVDFDRSPGLSSTFGPTNFGGSINLKSPPLFPDPNIRATMSYGSWDTRQLQLDADSGFFGKGSKNSFLTDIQQLLSDGYLSSNKQKRDAGYGKYQYRLSDRSALTVYGGLVDIWTNTPNTTSATRAQIAQYGDNFLLDSTPLLPSGQPDPYYYGYNTYHVQTDFEYVAYNADLGHGVTFDTKFYTTRYWNKQFYQNGGTVTIVPTSTPSGVDKLNGYRHAGNESILSWQNKFGIFRTGVWYDWSYTDRYQIPSNIVTHVDTLVGNFHEHFITASTQPFAEFEWHAAPKLSITLGVKDANYGIALNQYQDNGKIVGCLGGVLKNKGTANVFCAGGPQFVSHSTNYNNWLPNAAAHYSLTSSMSVYAQWAWGSIIPPSAVFDVTGGNVSIPQKPTLARTYQTGTVMKHRRWTLDVDAYYIHFQNGFDSYVDPVTTDTIWIPTGPSVTKGMEAESDFVLGKGFSLYLNGMIGSAKYTEGPGFPNGGLWVQDAPKNVETASFFWRHGDFDLGLVDKRVGMYYNDNGSINYKINGISLSYPADQAITINPFNVLNVFANYTIKGASFLRGSKIGLAVDNLADSHNITGVSPTTAAAPGALYTQSPTDVIQLLPGRSVMVTFTVGWAPRR